MIISRLVLLRMRNVSDKSCTEIKTKMLRPITFFLQSCCLWDNVGKYCSAGQATNDNISRRTRFACLIFSRLMAYTECPRRNVPDFGRVFLMLKYTDITQNTYIQSWTVTEIMAREVWNFDSCYTLIDYQIHIKTGRNMWFL